MTESHLQTLSNLPTANELSAAGPPTASSPHRLTHAAPLPYADVGTQHGVVLERRPDGGVTITVPPWPWYRRRGALITALLSVGLNVSLVGWSSWQSGRWGSFIWLSAGIGVAVVTLAAVHRLRRHKPTDLNDWAARFEVVGETLHVSWRAAQERAPQVSRFSCRRDEIVSIRGDLFRMGLTIRVRHRFMAEMLHERPKVVRLWITKVLCEALRIEHRVNGRGE
jgi:heme exporter protein D